MERGFNTQPYLDIAATMKRIAAVTFDLWDTLIQEYPGGSDRVAQLRVSKIASILEARGLPHSHSEIRAAYEKTGSFLQLTWSKRKDMSIKDQILFMLSGIDDKLAGKLSQAEYTAVEHAYVESILDHPPRLLPHAKEALEAVRRKEFRIGLISNTGRTPGSMLRVVMDKIGILDLFDATVFSNEILVRKPAEGAFRATLDKLKVVPKAAVHIGDDAISDIGGAKKVGMRAIQVLREGMPRSPLADAHVRSLEDIVDSIEGL